MEDAERKAKKIIAEQLMISEEEIIPDTFFMNLGGDSTTGVEITVAIEEAFGIRIPDEVSINTFNEALKYVNELVE